jgi:hydantoinase/carbamoylase family amidase
VLENEGLAVGVVTAIAGISRFQVAVTGVAGHAGTVPMGLRQDALAAAAECVLAVETVCSDTPGMVGTVGRLDVSPNADNVIPGGVRFGIDMRSGDDAVRAKAVDAVLASMRDICARRGLAIEFVKTHDNPCTPCASWLRQRIADAVETETGTRRELPSGAGHDAMALTGLADVAMLFLRCTGGVSHNPDEAVTTEDVAVALRVILRLIRDFEPQGSKHKAR